MVTVSGLLLGWAFALGFVCGIVGYVLLASSLSLPPPPSPPPPLFYLMLRFDEIFLYQWFSSGDLGGFFFFPMDYNLQCGDLG